MEKEEKIKVAITAGVVAVILLILVLFLALSGKKNASDDDRLNDSISQYASDTAEAASSNLSVDTASNVASSSASSADDSAAAATSDVPGGAEYLDPAKNSVSGNSFYSTNTAVLKNIYKGLAIDINSQLVEMYGYFEAGNLDAVRDLAHLDRFEAMSYKLQGTNNFYYYGGTDSNGKPSGKGLAVYANDQYYYGDWADGVRSGQGTWISYYPDYSTYVVTEHMYSGAFANDLPNGQGQEHYDYNPEYMNGDDFYLQNAIGEFVNGKYNGDMYIITVDNQNDTTEWYGWCREGEWAQVANTYKDAKGKIPVLYERLDESHLYYMTEAGTKNNGVSGIITGGSLVK